MAGDTQLDDVELWIALSLIKGLGSATLCQLLSHFASPEAIFSASISQLKQVVDENLAIAIHQGVDKNQIAPTLAWLQHEANHFITLADATYPKQLLEVSNPPATLYAKGNLQLLNRPCIAIVGSRNATPQGEKNAENFAENLCRQGLCVVSGMALGIDGAAHRGALKANGATIAVVGTGLDIVYPAKHKALAHQLASTGLIISEFALGTPSMAQNFPRRNRIISGLSLGCLVVEANIDSGSLITARLAVEQGREVFAIPGSIHSPVSKGCHQLIKQGAKLVESTDDIMSELQTQVVVKSIADSDSSVKALANSNLTLEAQLVLDQMGFEPIDYESLLALTGLNASALSTTLTLLELDGQLCNLQGAKFQRLV
jgi:DNA processing protein